MNRVQITEKIKKIKLLILDVDGVLTDGRIIYDSKGRDSKFFDVHDGLGVYLLKRAGIKTILITAKGSKTIKPRAKDMRVEEFYEDIFPKTKVLAKILKRHRIKAENICFIGDDLVDLSIMKAVGFRWSWPIHARISRPPLLYYPKKAAGARSGDGRADFKDPRQMAGSNQHIPIKIKNYE